MSRASTKSEPGRLAAALSLWSVRALLALFAVGTALALLALAEGAWLRGEVAQLEQRRLAGKALDALGEAVLAFDRRLQAAVPDSGGNPVALEAGAVRERLQALAAAAGPAVRLPTQPLLEHTNRTEAAAQRLGAGPVRSQEAAADLRAGLAERWAIFREAARAEFAREEAARLWRIGERSRQQRWLLLFVGLLAVAMLAATVWSSGGGVLAVAAQARALESGSFARAVEAAEGRGDCAASRAALGGAATALAGAHARQLAERARTERFFQRLEQVLAGVADGDVSHPLPPADDPASAGSLAALGRVVERLHAAESQAAAERSRTQELVALPREELYLLGQLLDLDPSRQGQAAAAFRADSPLREPARRVAALASGHSRLVARLEERTGRILSHSESVSGLVTEREADFRRESQLIHETSTTVNEVSVAAKQTAQMVEFVFRSSQEAMQAAEDGREFVRRTIEGMSVIEQRVGRIAAEILQLAGKTQEIGTIVKAIGDISKQTNLLALNAAIEAAGAGEHGRGFAVVAKEIRELAVKSSRSTQDIQRLIGEIQTATNSAVLSTEEGTKSVHGGVQLATALNQAFSLVVEKFQEVVESTQQISTAAQEQTAGARQVASSIASIDQMVRSTVEDLQGLRQMLDGYRGIAAELEQALRGAGEEQA